MADELAERITAFLDAHHVMSLATVGPHGPHAANLFYARDGFTLFWVSDPTSRHSVELDATGTVAATIARDYSDYATIRRLVDDAGRARARGILEARFVFLRQLADDGVRDVYRHADFYRLDVDRFVLIDNTRGFGHKDVLEVAAAG
jgi:uncharacterized protein YhbP (UPF0306 family)